MIPCVWLLNAFRLNEIDGRGRDLVAPEYIADPDGNYEDYTDFLTIPAYELVG